MDDQECHGCGRVCEVEQIESSSRWEDAVRVYCEYCGTHVQVSDSLAMDQAMEARGDW